MESDASQGYSEDEEELSFDCELCMEIPKFYNPNQGR